MGLFSYLISPLFTCTLYTCEFQRVMSLWKTICKGFPYTSLRPPAATFRRIAFEAICVRVCGCLDGAGDVRNMDGGGGDLAPSTIAESTWPDCQWWVHVSAFIFGGLHTCTQSKQNNTNSHIDTAPVTNTERNRQDGNRDRVCQRQRQKDTQ